MKLTNMLFFLIFTLVSHEVFASSDEIDEKINFEEQINCFQSAFKKLEETPQPSVYVGDPPIVDLSSDLAGICNQAIRLTREEFVDKVVEQERLVLLKKFETWLNVKIQGQKLGISDVKTLFYQLAFLRGVNNQQSDFVKTFIEKRHSSEMQSGWWHDEKHDFFQFFSSSFYPLCCEMYLIPDQGCPMVESFLRAFTKEPKTKITLLSFNQNQEPFWDPTEVFFRQVERPNIINWFRDSTEDLDVLGRVVRKLWVEDDSFSTACLYLLIRDFMIDKDDLIFDENREESKEDQYFKLWLEEALSRIKSLLLGKGTLATDFLNRLEKRINDGSDRKLSISMTREVQKEENKLTIPVSISLMNQTSSELPSSAIVDLVVDIEKKSDLIEDYKRG